MLQKSKTSTVPEANSGAVFYVPSQENLRIRARLKNSMREFFDQQNFLEVEILYQNAGVF